jgi:ABC-2 type transport system permease protein
MKSLGHGGALASAMLRVGFAEAVAYRAELFLWVLATTMPFIMMVLFSAVTADGPIGRYDQSAIIAYFLVTLVVRQVTTSWVAWQLGRDIRQGTLSLKLLRPVHPLLSYVVESVTTIPLRLLVMVPVFVISLFVIHSGSIAQRPESYALAVLAIFQGFCISVLMNLLIGCASFYLESATKLMDFVLVVFFVSSGYLIPVDLFPPLIRALVDALPFRYQLALPVELITGKYDHHLGEAVEMCLRQSLYTALFALLLSLVWRRGVRRFDAYGG